MTLKRPDFMGAFAGPKVLTLSNRDTHGANFGSGKCPAASPGAGTAPYEGIFDPVESMSTFNQYHAAPNLPETWTLKVKDVRKGTSPASSSAQGSYLHRI